MDLLSLILGIVIVPVVTQLLLLVKPNLVVSVILKFLNIFVKQPELANKVSNSLGVVMINIGKHLITYHEDDEKLESLMRQLNDIILQLVDLEG